MKFIDFDEEKVGVNDLKKERTIIFDNNKVFLTMIDPFGFVYARIEKGRLPKVLGDNCWTSFEEAKRVVVSYYASQNTQVKEIQE